MAEADSASPAGYGWARPCRRPPRPTGSRSPARAGPPLQHGGAEGARPRPAGQSADRGWRAGAGAATISASRTRTSNTRHRWKSGCIVTSARLDHDAVSPHVYSWLYPLLVLCSVSPVPSHSVLLGPLTVTATINSSNSSTRVSGCESSRLTVHPLTSSQSHLVSLTLHSDKVRITRGGKPPP